MGRKSSAKGKIIEAASHLFWRNGYEATGVAFILEKAGVGSGSFYWFFKTKEDLLLAVLESYRDLLITRIRNPAFERSDDPADRIFLVLDVYRTFLVETGYQQGCPIGNTILELGNKYPKVRQKTEELFCAWREMIHECLEAISERFPRAVDLQSLATFVLTTMEGGIMQARSHLDIRYFDESVANLRRYIGLLMAETNK